MAEGLRVGKFWFSSLVPKEVLDTCKDTLLKYECLIPNWCNEVRVYWDAEGNSPDDGENTATAYISTNYAYRFASLNICPPFLSEEIEDRETRLKHELCHIVSSPLVSYVRDTVAIVTQDEAMTQLVCRESTEKSESMTEDLAYILTQMEKTFSAKSSKKS
jgi:hypothetical protein